MSDLGGVTKLFSKKKAISEVVADDAEGKRVA